MVQGLLILKKIQSQTLVWEQEARVGPVLVLPAKAKSQPIPEEDVPLVLHKISRPSLYGSQWRSGIRKTRKECSFLIIKSTHLAN